jgi:putative Holliday junction resolvase
MTSRIHASVADLHGELAKGSLIGLDLGEKTIGIAVSDTTRSIASALLTIRRSKFTADAEQIL